MIRLASKAISFTHTTIKQDLGPIKYFLGSAVAQENVIIAITALHIL